MKLSSWLNYFMKEAIKEAKKAYINNEIPVGAIIVNSLNKEIVGRGFNTVEKKNNPTLHAEMIAINNACKNLKSKVLENCDIYVTLEPCSMCSAAISIAQINRLFYGASNIKQGAIEHGIRYFTTKDCIHRPEIYPNVGESYSIKILKNFFYNVRRK